jgi:hypothetical protein
MKVLAKALAGDPKVKGAKAEDLVDLRFNSDALA